MTNLSPTAQAVLDAYIYVECGTPSGMALAYALRAAADQVVPEDGDPIYGLTPARAERQVVRHKLLAIATELESHSE